MAITTMTVEPYQGWYDHQGHFRPVNPPGRHIAAEMAYPTERGLQGCSSCYGCGSRCRCRRLGEAGPLEVGKSALLALVAGLAVGFAFGKML